MTNRRGFTLVELIIVIVVIAILATVATLGLNQYLQNGRDNQRKANVTTIAEALEKYFDKNGEYPGCTAITAAGATVANNTLKGIDQSALLVPDETGSNSIRCNATLATTGTDFIQYVGDGSSTCTSGVACLSYKLRYRSERDNAIRELDSRRNANIATSGQVNVTAAVNGFTAINVNWSTVLNSTGYTLQRATNDTFSSGLVSSNTTGSSTAATGLTPGVEYFFRVRPYTPSETGEWSNVASAETKELGQPTISTVVNSTSQITASWTAADEADSATRYTLQRATNSTFTTGLATYSNLNALSHVSTGLAVGDQYYFRVQAATTGDTSPWSNTASSVTIPGAPTGVSATVNSATQYTISWNASAGATSYIVRYGTTTAANTYSATTSNTSLAISSSILQGTRHYFKVYAAASGLESAASSTVNGTTPINAPAAFSITKSTSSTAITTSAASAVCASGTTKYYLWKVNGSNWVSGTGYSAVTYNLSPGQSVTLTASVRCQKGSIVSSYRNSSNSQSHSRAGMNLSISFGADECAYGFCGRRVNANWNAVCGSVRPTISARQLSASTSWLADSTTSDGISWKGASSPGVIVTYTVPLGCTTGTASFRVISRYKCTGCS
ncbi:MAG: fibronectin type III domain-containing protein [Candidatus Microsaccharimonas sp.]